MSLIDNLPPVIKPEVHVKPEVKVVVEPKEKFDLELKEYDPETKRFIIVCSRDLSAEDEDVFKQHGKTLRWKKESFLNLPFEQLDFDFLFIDIREKEARLTLNRQDLSKYNKVAYVFAIQKGVDDFLSEIDTVDISSIPKYAINAKDFKHQLLTQKITAPSLAKSFLRFFVRCFLQ
jgi:hypothetical protein